jgi:hypothetical protein
MPKTVRQTLQGADLDITGYKLKRERLVEQILEDVKATQMFVGRHLPDKLFMTKDQFELLEDDMELMENTVDRIYITPMNVMEVHVVDAGQYE